MIDDYQRYRALCGKKSQLVQLSQDFSAVVRDIMDNIPDRNLFEKL
jgi:hypothetical protein